MVVRGLSILIPARNEMFLGQTIKDILANRRGDTEIIAVLDGAWPMEPLPVDERLTVVFLPEPIGQRAACNLAAKLSGAKYVMKVDAHCAFDEGFDVKLMDKMQDDYTMVPAMKNLWAFDWKCADCGLRTYQGPTPEKCTACEGTNVNRKLVWKPNPKRPTSTSYRFDKTLHFQYFPEFKKRPEGQGELTETMSLQGSCFMLTREKYWELDVCDEKAGSWGHQGSEVALKTWLSGGRVVCNQTTWYAHMFRTQGGDFGFPYPQRESVIEKSRQHIRDLFLNKKWDKAIRDVDWLVNKFGPVPGWEES